MLDVAPSELLLVAFVALIVIGPKDLPRAMRFVGQWVGKARSVARHFRSGLDSMVREAELADLEKQWAEENARIMREHPPSPPALPQDDKAARPADGSQDEPYRQSWDEVEPSSASSEPETPKGAEQVADDRPPARDQGQVERSQSLSQDETLPQDEDRDIRSV